MREYDKRVLKERCRKVLIEAILARFCRIEVCKLMVLWTYNAEGLTERDGYGDTEPV